jgi:thymidylate synthase
MIKTYLSEKYKVYFGQGQSIGLVTCWSDPELLVSHTNELMSHVSILGSLYSQEGVSVIIRNLALNPQIRRLIIWTNSPLSNTAIGKSGLNLLKKLFKTGVEPDNTITGTSHKLHQEINNSVIKKILDNVEFIDLTDLKLTDLINQIAQLENNHHESYMSPVEFPETRRDTSLALPSEEIGWIIRDKNLVNVWLKVIDKILRYGSVRLTDYGNNQKELQYVTWVIENENIDSIKIPDWPVNVLDACGFSHQKIDEYKNSLLNSELPAETSYTYGYRLRNYQQKVDQVNELVRLLKESIVTRRAFATTFIPPEDLFKTSPPCLTSIQVMADVNQKINMFVNFRSHDMFKAALSNATALLNLQKYISIQAGYHIGKLVITSVSAHIYEEEWDMAEKLVECQFRSKIATTFNELTDIDARGMFRISIKNKTIFAELVDSSGNVLYDIQGNKAKDIALKFAKLDLLSKNDHYCDLSLELSKAEYCLISGRSYQQDHNSW